ncbi:MAG: hypothetical protein LUG90_19250 [Clostridiaceae bacterium]|nr:hypothetical protein [Clostridiaceae bacterium]
MQALIEENARQGECNAEFNEKYCIIAECIEQLKKEQVEERNDWLKIIINVSRT